MSKEVKRLLFEDLVVGSIVKVCAGKGTKTRKIHQLKTHDYGNGTIWKSIWSIPVRFDATTNSWVEECMMCSNQPIKFNKIFLLEDDVWDEYRLEIIC